MVRRADGPLVLEVELEPAATVDADALARLGLEIDGQPVQTAFAVTVPGPLRQTDQRHLEHRLSTASLTWREWRLDQGVRRAGSRLYQSPGTLARVAEVFNAPPGDEAATATRVEISPSIRVSCPGKIHSKGVGCVPSMFRRRLEEPIGSRRAGCWHCQHGCTRVTGNHAGRCQHAT